MEDAVMLLVVDVVEVVLPVVVVPPVAFVPVGLLLLAVVPSLVVIQ